MAPYPPIRIVRPAFFNRQTAQTPGSERRSAIAVEMGIETQMWGGIFVIEPGGKTGIHHHGKQETIAYVLEGHCLVRWGEHGEFSEAAQSGDFIHVPPWLPHMEANSSGNSRCVWVVVRSTAEPIVINLPNDFWGPEQHSG
jgi:uncharacterized RmlC-like cupin family protein